MTRQLSNNDTRRQFIIDGYTQVQADYPPEFHKSIYEKLDAVYEKEGNPGNNILPRVPEIQEIFDHPDVRAALTGLLGLDYAMHPHRHGHLNSAGGRGQTWHKDDYIFDQNVRHHRCRWVMAFYYPQDVTEDMGPTGVVPGRQYYNEISDTDPMQANEDAISLCGPAGTVSIVNFDSWHRATENVSKKNRFMLKFQFTRMKEPEVSAADDANEEWESSGEDRLDGLWRDVWDWHAGNLGSNPPDLANGSVDRLIKTLRHEYETERLVAVYALGALGEQVVPALLDALHFEARSQSEEELGKSPANPKGTNPSELPAAYALSAVGSQVVPALIEELAHDHWAVRAASADVLGNLALVAGDAVQSLSRCLEDVNVWVRRNAAEALGNIAEGSAASALTAGLNDEDWRIRFNIAFALAKIGSGGEEAVPALGKLLRDENRYVRHYAALALNRIGTPKAQELIWDDLITARWCPLTTPESRY